MKQLTLILIFMAICLTAFAQTGLFGLSYLDSFATCTEKLSKSSFKLTSEDPAIFQDLNETEIRLYFSTNPKQLVAWWVIAPPDVYGGYDEVEEYFIIELEKLHGSDFDYDWDYLEAFWRLDEEHYVSAAFDAFMDDYWIFYGHDKYPEFLPY